MVRSVKDAVANGVTQFCRKGVDNLSPLVYDIRGYQKENAKADTVAGLTVGVLLIPQALAYAQLAHLPPVYGLYTSIMPTLIYAFFGASNTMSLGTIALCGLMTGEVVTEFVDPDDAPDAAVDIALAVAFLSGCFLLFLRLVNFGPFIRAYLSPALISGFQIGAGFHIAISQMKYILGIPAPTGVNGAFHIPKKAIYYLKHLKEANLSAVVIAVSTIAIIQLCSWTTKGRITLNLKRCCEFGRSEVDDSVGLFFVRWQPTSRAKPFTFPIPGELIVVVLGEVVSQQCKFSVSYGTGTVGIIPAGLPDVVNLDWSWVYIILTEKYFEVITIAMLTIGLTISDGQTYAERFDRPLEINREISVLAAVNIISPFFGCYIGGAGLSRSALANSVSDGNHLTQLYAIGTVLVVAIVLLCMVDMLKELPVAVLGSVVLMALRGLIRKLEEWRSYWNVGRSSDFVIWIVTMLTTIFLDLDYGILIGFVVTIHTVFDRLARAELTVQGRIPGGKNYVDVSKYPEAIEHRGVKVVRLDSALFFGSRDRLYYYVKKLVTVAPEGRDRIHTIVIDASAVIFLDSAGIVKLCNLASELRKRYDASVLVAEASDKVRDTLLAGGFIDLFPGKTLLYRTIGEAQTAGIAAATFDSSKPKRVASMSIAERWQARRRKGKGGGGGVPDEEGGSGTTGYGNEHDVFGLAYGDMAAPYTNGSDLHRYRSIASIDTAEEYRNYTNEGSPLIPNTGVPSWVTPRTGIRRIDYTNITVDDGMGELPTFTTVKPPQEDGDLPSIKGEAVPLDDAAKRNIATVETALLSNGATRTIM